MTPDWWTQVLTFKKFAATPVEYAFTKSVYAAERVKTDSLKEGWKAWLVEVPGKTSTALPYGYYVFRVPSDLDREGWKAWL